MRFETAKRKYKNEWIAFRIEEGKVLAHDKDRHGLHRKLKARKAKIAGAYITFTGRQLPREFSIVLITQP